MILLRRYQRCQINGERYLFLATVRKHIVHGTETMIEHTEVCRVVETARHVRIQPVGEMGPELQEAALKFAGIMLEGDE